MVDGLDHAAERFPSPPVPPAVLKAHLDDYQEKSAVLAGSRAEARILGVDKDKALKTLRDSMRAEGVPTSNRLKTNHSEVEGKRAVWINCGLGQPDSVPFTTATQRYTSPRPTSRLWGGGHISRGVRNIPATA